MSSPRKRLTYKGESLYMSQWARRLGITRQAMFIRLAKYRDNPQELFRPSGKEAIPDPPSPSGRAGRPPYKSESDQFSHIISLSFTKSQLEDLRNRAKASGITFRAFCRQLLTKGVE